MKKILLAILIFSGIFTISCEEDDVCVGEGTPYLTVVFRNNLGTQNVRDSLTIESADNIEFNDAVLILPKTLTDSVKLPLGGLDDSQNFFRIKRKSNPESDILTVNYTTKSEYVSKACGFRVTYEDLSYTSTFNYFQSIDPSESNVLTDETTTNLYIRFSN